MVAAVGVFGMGTGWPDLIVAAIVAALSISGGWQIIRRAHGELRSMLSEASRLSQSQVF